MANSQLCPPTAWMFKTQDQGKVLIHNQYCGEVEIHTSEATQALHKKIVIKKNEVGITVTYLYFTLLQDYE